MDHVIGEFLMLLATVDPVGTLTLFLGLTAGMPAAEQRQVALRAIGYASLILVSFIFVGQAALTSLGIRLASFELAGGIILFLFGVQMVFGTGAAAAARPEEGHDMAVFPLAVPSIASPGSILAAVVLTDNQQFSIAEQAITTGLLLVILGFTLLLLLQSERIGRVLGRAGANLLVRLMGLILAALAIEMILDAINQVIAPMS